MAATSQDQQDDEMSVAPARAASLAASLSTIRAAVSRASASAPADHRNGSKRPVRLVAVSKLKPASDILALLEPPPPSSSSSPSQQEHAEPQYHFGENYVQELQHKASILPRSVRWHFIGGLQTNKCRGLAEGVPNLWCVASVDTAKKADQLEKGRAALCDNNKEADRENVQDEADRLLRVYVQVNTSGEESKSGVEPGDASVELCRHIKSRCPHLRLAGLMTIGAIARSTAGGENEDFVTLRNERDTIAAALGMAKEDIELSMGMSADFEEAIRQGSDEVRVGSQIFGARPLKQSKEAKGEVEEAES